MAGVPVPMRFGDLFSHFGGGRNGADYGCTGRHSALYEQDQHLFDAAEYAKSGLISRQFAVEPSSRVATAIFGGSSSR